MSSSDRAQYEAESRDRRLAQLARRLANPTDAELAPFIFRMFRNGAAYLPVVAVRVYESSTTWCEVSEPLVPRPVSLPVIK